MAKSKASKRPKLAPVSEEMAHRCALLAEELLRWPDVRARPMFGMRAFYRGAVVFAMLPGKRALEDPDSIAYKLAGTAGKSEGEKWQLCPLKDARDISRALARLDQAHRIAGGRNRKE